MLTLAGPCDFNQLRPGFCWPRMTLVPILEWIFLCWAPPWQSMHPHLKISQFCCFGGEHCFGKYPWCLFYLLPIKSLIFLLFGLIVPFGSTPTKRWIQFQVTLWPLFVPLKAGNTTAVWKVLFRYRMIQGILITKERV